MPPARLAPPIFCSSIKNPTVSTAYPQVNFSWIGSAFNCSVNTGSPVCRYASLNGYSGSNVSVGFPPSLPNAPAIPPGFGTIAHPYIQVSITDPVPMSFTKLVSANTTFNISAKAGCGVLSVLTAAPITVLSPTANGALTLKGAATIAIYGGPQKSIQVNSHSASALSAGSGIDLSHANPSYTGGDIGVFGGPSTNPGVVLGSTGHYLDPSSPITDPFATVPEPSPTGMPVQASSGSGTVLYKANGCPDSGGCTQYLPGNYTTGISVKNGTSIFDPGIYYVKGGLALQANSTVRPSAKNATTAPYGTIFYLTGCTTGPSSCVKVDANSGKSTSLDPFSSSSLGCPGGPGYVAPPGVTPPTEGNILMAPCTGPYGDSTGLYRGILFFVDRSISAADASWGGGGSFILAGAIYVHNPNSFGDTFTMGGNSGSTSLVIGDIVVDMLTTAGTPNISMQLNPNTLYSILKVELLQ